MSPFPVVCTWVSTFPGKGRVMQGPSRRSVIFTVIFATINIAGLVWIHHGVTRAPRATVRVLAASWLPDADSPDKLRLVFDRDLVGAGAVGRVEKAAVFQLAPACPGRWTWSAPDQLEYLLDKPLPAGRMVKLAATAQLKAVTGRTLEGPREFRLAARPLRWVSCDVTAADNHDLTLRVTFNQPVEPGEFLRHATFCDAKTGVRLPEPTALIFAPQSDMVIRLPRPASNRFRMVIDEHLVGYGGDAGLDSPVRLERTVARGFGLLHAYVERPDLEETVAVQLYFSQELKGEQQAPRLVVEPAVEDLQVHLADRSLVAMGRFQAGARYTIRVPDTLLAQDGRTLGEGMPGEGVSVTVQVRDYEPRLRFEQSRGILSPWGRLQLDAKGVNLEQVAVQAWRVHANNLVPHLHWTEQDETSRSVADKTIAMKLPHNQPGKLVLDLSDLLPRPLGIYRVEASSADHRWTRDATIVTITDLAITAKRHRDGYLVWVTSLRTAEPVADVVVNGLTYNNQKVATVKTDAAGLARLQFAGRHPDGEIWVITASRDADLSYLLPDENQWVLDDAEPRGRSYGNHYETMLYTDRGVYRPGETIHLTGVIRDMEGAVPSGFPLAVKVHRPDGRRVAELKIERRAGDQGMFHTSFTPSGEAQTGPYGFQVTLPGSEELLGAATALVEAFVPVRMEVTAAPAHERFGPNTPAVVQVSGRYLWDQPAADLPVKLEGTLRRIAFTSKTQPDFQFGWDRREAPIPLPAVEGQLDGQGGGEIQVQQPENLPAGLYRMQVSATVTEPGGRSVSANTAAALDLLDLHIGLRPPQGRVIAAGETVAVDWVRVTGQDGPANPGEMKVQLLRVHYDTVLKRIDDRHVWHSVERTQPVGAERAIAATDVRGVVEIVCPDAGTYRLVVTDAPGGGSTCLEFYASRGDDGPQSLPMNQPQRVEIVTDKTKYQPGETAKVLLRSAVPGTVLLTVETDRVLAQHTAQIADNTCALEVPLPRELRGSVFLTATVVRPVDPDRESWLPH
ncbi:MAG: hypothetical protein FJ280_23560, partial [Planctomycetes bacterium]|nr:hypothetical protein [Planctomycetota bacterium]